ncbi:MAG TPA: DUF1707 domain-containing protein [Streptosporangiaceae bacterium]|nr:DUF1707 domain-containing protein [Streptosporangiaceae bacterium]
MRGDVLVSDAERDAVAARLRDHFAAGRLSSAEFQDRLDAAYAARSDRDLTMLTADLPHDAGAGFARVRYSRGSGPWPRGYRPQRSPAQGPQTQRPRRRSRIRSRILLASAMVAAGCVLLAFALPHGGLLGAALIVLLTLTVLTVAAVGTLAWLARRIWRRGAWLEALPLVVGMPWLSRVLWAVRLLWTGRVLWRLRARLRRA